MKSLEFQSVEPIRKGWSKDKKYRVVTKIGEPCLLRISDLSAYAKKEREYAFIKKLSRLGISMSQPIAFGVCEQGVYLLLSWVEGKDLEQVLPTLSDAEQYRLGREAGTILRKIHSLPLDPADRPAGTKREKKLLQLSRYEQCASRQPDDAAVVQYVKDHIDRIWQVAPAYLHGDFHPGNLILQPDGSIGVIDFNRWEVGDPYEEYYKLQSFGREVSIPYSVGQIDAYFDEQIPAGFWEALAVYVAHASVGSIQWAEKFGASEVAGMVQRYRIALDDYDGFRTVIPHWYLNSAARRSEWSRG